jgi:hypothetical protein
MKKENFIKVAFKIFSLSIFIICFYGADEGVQYRLQTNNQDEGGNSKNEKNECIRFRII